jgi:hypothetical protein
MTKYEPPLARDISMHFAKGNVTPMGACKYGTLPYYSCVAGPVFVGACGGGSAPDTSACNVGGYHFTPSCNFGGSAATICVSGAHQQ